MTNCSLKDWYLLRLLLSLRLFLILSVFFFYIFYYQYKLTSILYRTILISGRISVGLVHKTSIFPANKIGLSNSILLINFNLFHCFFNFDSCSSLKGEFDFFFTFLGLLRVEVFNSLCLLIFFLLFLLFKLESCNGSSSFLLKVLNTVSLLFFCLAYISFIIFLVLFY